MKLHIGESAKDFTAKDIYGKQIRLSDYKGKKILLSFFRNVNCPFCNLRVHELTKLKSYFDDRDLQMVFLFESSNKLLALSTFHQGISPIPLVGDPEKNIYYQYGIEKSVLKFMKTFLSSTSFKMLDESKKLGLPTEQDKAATATLMPADFLIDKNFVIQQAHYGQDARNHIDLEVVKNF